MPYFTHIQLKCNLANARKISRAFFKSTDKKSLSQELAFYFPQKRFIFTDMGRTAFRVIIDNLGLADSSMLLPAYICDIFYPILQEFNITPIFLDIDSETFNIKIHDIENKITPETKSILVCHTYGLPLEMGKISEIAKKYNLKVIEDIAHAISGKYQRKYLGNFGHVAFTSLYKQFPCLRGGMIIAPDNWQVSLKKTKFNFRDFISLLNYFSFFSFILKKFFNPVAPKFLRKEKHKAFGTINKISINLFANFLPGFENRILSRKKSAIYLRNELEKLGFKFQKINGNVFTFLSAMVPDEIMDKRDEFVQKLRKRGVFCVRIWRAPIILNPEAQKVFEINPAEFKNTIKASQTIINIPLQNNFSQADCDRIISKIKSSMLEIQKESK